MVDRQDMINEAKPGPCSYHIWPKQSHGRVQRQWGRKVHTTHMEGEGK